MFIAYILFGIGMVGLIAVGIAHKGSYTSDTLLYINYLLEGLRR